MDVLCIVIFFLSIFLFFALRCRPPKRRLPPGPSSIPLLSTIRLLTKSHFDLEPILRNLHAKYGPILTIHIANKPAIFINDRILAHQALIEHGPTISDRPPANESNRIFSSNRHNISAAPYGPLWRLFRRNLTTEIIHPSRTKNFSNVRKWTLDILLNKLRTQAEIRDGFVIVMESFQFAMFSLLVLMCFGEKLDEKSIREIEKVEKSLHRYFAKSKVFAFLPKVTKIVFRDTWNTLLEIRRGQEELFIPLIRSARSKQSQNGTVRSYVESLLNLHIPEEGGRKLTEDEIVSLSSEFLSGGTDTTATGLEWIMAELVIHEEIQQKLRDDIEKVVPEDEEIKEEDLQKMTYLKVVILEGLRRHPPVHFVAPHTVTEEMSIGGYLIPKNAIVNFMVAEMGWDEKVWDAPMEFKPERFLEGGAGEGMDITGGKEIKMMPFGAGRRICPGRQLAILNLEYFVANLVREFEWKKGVEGEEVDLSEKMELTVVMKNHLKARIVPRRGNKSASSST